ncbi:hypothetical protein [Parvibaculum sp.]|uniref:hypothetical protein n=1 Tax=Parvibaculum sp. TaxID=2024848 RepID=UPI002CCEDFF1|nr:hypothetical protein [Parvibaculum sp.]HUD52792.1 hypothetical protein [Parvibaculum sp.]
MPPKMKFLTEHLRHAVLPLPVVGFFLTILYGFGYVDIPASKSEVGELRERVTKLEASHGDVGRGLQDLKEQNARQSQKLDDVKQNVDRLVGALIDGGLNRHAPSNYRKQ